jgi:hypothetical protein
VEVGYYKDGVYREIIKQLKNGQNGMTQIFSENLTSKNIVCGSFKSVIMSDLTLLIYLKALMIVES